MAGALVAGLAWAWPLDASAQPAANFRAEPNLGEAPLTVKFTNRSEGVPPLRFRWDFGDGAISEEENPEHTFSVPRAEGYRVVLTVTDGTGLTDSKEQSITVDGPTLLAALLPVSRSVVVGGPATAFLTIINAGRIPATDVRVRLDPSTGPGGGPLPATLTWQRTDPATNQVIGAPNELVTLPPGGSQTYVVTVVPTDPVSPTDVRFDIQGTNSTRHARKVSGLNTLLLSASPQPTPDIVAVAATPTADGVLELSGAPPAGAFSVATTNVGAPGTITVSADTGNTAVPVSVLLCLTDPGSGQCAGSTPPQPTASVFMAPGANATFSVFVSAFGPVPNNPESNRVFVRFSADGATRGATSVAVKTAP